MRALICSLAALAASAGPALAQTPHAPTPAPMAPASPRVAPTPSVQAIAPPAPARTWTRFQRASELQVRDLAGFVRVTPENRSDVMVAVTNPGPLASPELRVSGNRLIVDGNLRRQIRGCRVGEQGGFEVTTTRHGRLSASQLTVIDVRVPQNAVVGVEGAVRLTVRPSQTATIRMDGCGDADIERVADEATIALAGSPDLRLYEAGSVRIAIAGAGDAVVGVVREGLTASIAGTGGLVVSRADGPTNIAIQGSGDVNIRDGRASVLAVAVAGSGDVLHNGVAGRLNAAVIGSGDVRVRRVEGEVSRRVLGSGEVSVGR